MVTRPSPDPTDGKETSMSSGKATLIANLGYPTHGFKARLSYTRGAPKRHRRRCRADGCEGRAARRLSAGVLFVLTNVRGSRLTMPHKDHHDSAGG
jgi:hypothetical protein